MKCKNSKCKNLVDSKDKRIVFCSKKCFYDLNNEIAINNYIESPKICKNDICGKVLPYEKRVNLYCDHICAATYTNKNRTHSDETKNKISLSLKKTSKKCEYCKQELKLRKNKFCDKICFGKSMKCHGRKLSKETKEKISESRKNKFLNGELNVTGGFKRMKLIKHLTWYGKVIKLRSSYELKYAKQLDLEKINYSYESIRIKYWDS